MTPAAILTGAASVDRDHNRITQVALTICEWNDPNTKSDNVGSSSNMRTYHAPGEQQCASAMRKLEKLLRETAEAAERIRDNAQIRERGSAVVDNVGDIETNAVEVAENPVRVDKYVHYITVQDNELQSAIAHRNAMTRKPKVQIDG